MPQISNALVLNASELGSKLNTVLQTGLTPTGTTPANDGPTLSAFLASGTPTAPVTLILDGPLTASGLFGGAGNWNIEGRGWDTGFFMAAGSNDDCIRNGAASPNSVNPMFDPGSNGLPSWVCAFNGMSYSFSSFSLPARATNIRLANFAINGNRGDGHTGCSSTGDPKGLAMVTQPGAATNRFWCGIRIENVDGLILENIKIQDTASFATRFTNVARVVIRGINISEWGSLSPEYGPPANYSDVYAVANGDGLHFNGNSHDIHISDGYLSTTDDAIAFNACEGYPGPISNAVVSNMTFHNCQTFGRFYATNETQGTAAQTGSVSNIRYVNCTGTANEVGWIFGLETNYTRAANYDRLTDISLSGDYTAPALCGIFDNVGCLTLDNLNWTGSQVWGVAAGMVAFAFTGAIANAITVKNCTLRRTAANNAGKSLIDFATNLVFGGGTTGTHVIGTLTISGFDVRDDGLTSFPNLPYLIRMNSTSTIQNLVINALNTNKIGALCDPQYLAQIGNVSGPGVLATGWQFPDSMMANNTPYISATGGNAGKVVIKLNGTVTPL